MKTSTACVRLPLILAILALSSLSVPGQTRPPAGAPAMHGANASSRAGRGMEAIGLSFIENRGQIVDTRGDRRPDILYTAGAGAVRMYLRRGAISYVFQRTELDTPLLGGQVDPARSAPEDDGRGVVDHQRRRDGRRVTSYRLDVELLGGNPQARVSAGAPGSSYGNYYLRHCPEGITKVRSYHQVSYHDIYPGIDLVFHADGEGMKYDFVVHAGADPSSIRLRYAGADQVERLSDGSLRTLTMLGSLSEGAPYSYQGENAARGEVRCRYDVRGDEVRFVVGEYDRSRTLVIDPTLQWATYIGGNAMDVEPFNPFGFQIDGGNITGADIAADADGGVVMTGATFSPNFPIAAGTPFQATLAALSDIFIIKLNGAGTPLWSTFFGGSDDEGSNGIAIGRSDGNIAVCGRTESSDLPVGLNALYPANAGGTSDAFIALFDQSGARRWGTYYGGSNMDRAQSVTVDGSGNVAVAGSTRSSDLPLSSTPFQGIGGGEIDAFVVSLTSAGGLRWATYFGGVGKDDGRGIASDNAGNVVLAGGTRSVNLPVPPNAFQLGLAGGNDAYLVKFDPDGTRLWGRYVGGAFNEEAQDVVCDSSDNIYICGETFSPGFPVGFLGFQTAKTSSTVPALMSYDAFVLKFDPDGLPLWGTFYDGTVNTTMGGTVAFSIATGMNNTVFITGMTFCRTLAVTDDALQATPPWDFTLTGVGSAFLVAFDQFGSRLYATYYGSTQIPDGWIGEVGYGVAANKRGEVYITGSTPTVNGLPGAGLGFQPVTGGGAAGEPSWDGFIAKFDGFCQAAPPLLDSVMKLCHDHPLTISAPPGYARYLWSPGRATTADLQVTTPGIYTLTVFDANGCASNGMVKVRQMPRPQPTIVVRQPLVICQGDSILLDGTLGGGVRYAWSSGQSTPTIWAKAAGSYGVTVTDTNGCIESAPPVHLVVNPRPPKPLLPAGPIYICRDSAVVLASNTVYERYLWSNGAKTPSIRVTTPGAYFLTGYNEFDCGSTSDPITVLHYPAPAPVIVVHGSRAICQGDSTELEVSGGPFSRVRWSTGQGTQRIKVGKGGVYSVVVWSPEGCWGGPDTATITILPAPRATISGPEEVCADAATKFTVPGELNLRYSWELTGNGTIVGGGDRPEIAVRWGSSGGGTLKVTVTDPATGCSTTTVRQVVIGTELKPVITAGGPTTFCRGDSVMLDAGYGMKRYRWSTGDTTFSIVVKDAGLYNVYVEDSSGCKGTSSLVEVAVADPPAPAITGPATVCLNTTAGYATADRPGEEYSWTVSGGVIIAGQGTSAITVQWGGGPAGTVDLVEASGNGACLASAPRLEVAIGAEPAPLITLLGSADLCQGESLTLDAGEGYGSYQWSSGETTRTIVVTEPGRYAVTVGVGAGCVGSSEPVTITVHPPPAVSIALLGPTTFCQGDSLILDAGAGYAAYRWSNGDTTRRITVKASGSYTVAITDDAGCAATSAPVSVQVEPLPTPAITGPLKVCSNSTISYTAPDVPGHRYQWTVAEGTIIDGQGTSRIRVRWGSNPRGVIDLVEANTAGRCPTAAGRYLVDVGADLEPLITPNGLIDLCEGESVVLDAGDGYSSYAWSTRERTRRISVGSSGVYWVNVADSSGCNGGSQTVTVTVHARPQPVITPGGPVTLRPGDSVALDAGAGYAGYLWSTGETSRLITVGENGAFEVTVTDSAGCRGRATVSVTIDTVRKLAGETEVELGVVEATPGELVRVPLTLRGSRELPANDLPFAATVRYRASLLAPLNAASSRIDGNDGVLDVRGVLPAGVTSGRLLELEFLALLGDTTATALRLERFAWEDTSIAVVTRDGSYTLTGLCISGPTRLVGSAGHLVLKPVRPNPASGHAAIEYEITESGRTRLEIVDMLGRQVGEVADGDLQPGRYGAVIDASALPSGIYIITLRTPTRQLSVPMQVRR